MVRANKVSIGIKWEHTSISNTTKVVKETLKLMQNFALANFIPITTSLL